MSESGEHVHIRYKKEHGAPWAHIVGLILSIALTLIALWLVQAHAMTNESLLTVILILAVIQILVQLFFFMHITESEGPAWHVWMLILAFFFAFAIIAGSLWIMTFGY